MNFTNLNCKENDLAIIVRTNGDPCVKAHLGKIVQLVGPVEDVRGNPAWRYEGPYLMRTGLWQGVAMPRILDCILKPLDAELDGEDLYLDRPTEAEFLADNPDFREIPSEISGIVHKIL